ncbi:MAG: hypothetical protein A2138_27980 [Deltaproteobacteria bacterium RBG_16_71_12]|nr:MAG: hypothetical protein A2138_27980 [Deltaproteobacteria bacterium RBG_16_71_12]
MKTIAITIENTMLERLDGLVRAAPRRGRRARPNRSEMVREALRRYLAEREREVREEAERKIWARHLGRINRQAASLVAEQAEP